MMNPLAQNPMAAIRGSSTTHKPYLIWCHKEIDEVVLELLQCLLDAVLEELLQFPGDDGFLVVDHVGEVDIVMVL
jgi:hypothetical protein